MDITKAIQTLQARNQSYVDRKGKEDSYSKKSDEIINSIIEYYNATESQKQTITDLQNECDRLNILLKIWGVDPGEYKLMNILFLKALYFHFFLNDKIPLREYDHHMEILLNHFSNESILNSYKTILSGYAETGQEFFKKNYPELSKYFNKNLTPDILTILETDFYDGNIK